MNNIIVYKLYLTEEVLMVEDKNSKKSALCDENFDLYYNMLRKNNAFNYNAILEQGLLARVKDNNYDNLPNLFNNFYNKQEEGIEKGLFIPIYLSEIASAYMIKFDDQTRTRLIKKFYTDCSFIHLDLVCKAIEKYEHPVGEVSYKSIDTLRPKHASSLQSNWPCDATSKFIEAQATDRLFLDFSEKEINELSPLINSELKKPKPQLGAKWVLQYVNINFPEKTDGIDTHMMQNIQDLLSLLSGENINKLKNPQFHNATMITNLAKYNQSKALEILNIRPDLVNQLKEKDSLAVLSEKIQDISGRS